VVQEDLEEVEMEMDNLRIYLETERTGRVIWEINLQS
jgi:hypothetical protein